MDNKTFYLYKSNKEGKKYAIRSIHKTKTIHFGAKGYDDYRHHLDKERKDAYLARHEKNEDWTKSGIETSGFWSRWLLWNKETLEESIKDCEKRFDIDIIHVKGKK